MTIRNIENPDAISLSIFEDEHEDWAKRWCQVVRVRVEFSDGRDPLYLTLAEYKSLPPALQALITRAPSSPPAQDVLLKIVRRVDGLRDKRVDGLFVKHYSPSGHGGYGILSVTKDMNDARKFADALEAMEVWAAVSTTHPKHANGKPNRPLTMYTVEVVPSGITL